MFSHNFSFLILLYFFFLSLFLSCVYGHLTPSPKPQVAAKGWPSTTTMNKEGGGHFQL
jgi:hypothetical protein